MSAPKIRAEIPEAFEDLFRPCRYKVYYGGRGGAKSWAFARALLIKGYQQPLRILCTREFQKSIRESVHKLLANQVRSLGLQEFYTVEQRSIFGPNGTEFIFAGLRLNIEEIKSTEGIDICWVEEAETTSETSWEILIPTIRTDGSEIWASFNPRLKQDPTYQRFILNPPEDAIVRKVNWRENPWFPDTLREEKDRLQKADYEKYLHIYEGELRQFAEGAIYAQQMRLLRERGQICSVPIEPSCEVNTFWDLGKGDATAIWFHQRVGKEDRFIDYYENRLVDLDHYIRAVKEKEYNYGTHYLPHDVEHQILGLGNRTRKEMLEDGGIRPITVVPKVGHIEEGIEQVRAKLPSCWIDKDRCARGIECLQNYRYEYNETKDAYHLNPVHDWASDGADAFRQYAQGYMPDHHWGELNYPTKWVV